MKANLVQKIKEYLISTILESIENFVGSKFMDAQQMNTFIEED